MSLPLRLNKLVKQRSLLQAMLCCHTGTRVSCVIRMGSIESDFLGVFHVSANLLVSLQACSCSVMLGDNRKNMLPKTAGAPSSKSFRCLLVCKDLLRQLCFVALRSCT